MVFCTGRLGDGRSMASSRWVLRIPRWAPVVVHRLVEDMGVSQNRGPKIRSQYTMVLIMRASQKGLLIFGNSHMELRWRSMDLDSWSVRALLWLLRGVTEVLPQERVGQVCAR